VRRFISHEELARDRRFKRSESRALPALPDDAEEIARLLEDLAPSLRDRVRGTALEKVYDELGPGFQLLVNFGGLRAQQGGQGLQLRMQLHGIFVGEMQALEAAARTLWDFPDAPWEFKLNMARQCWDEARHVQTYEKLLERAGGALGEFPETTFLFETGCADDPLLRVTGVNRCIEGLACDVFRMLIEYGKAVGDDVMAQAIDFVLADELTHVRFGSDWAREFTKNDPERAKRAKDFQLETERAFAFGGRRRLAREDRREAGFTDAELDEIEEIALAERAKRPSRETLQRAAALLLERHKARRRGEDVPPLRPAPSA
jgi:uncharacterized ferritin-like protein (DUF455 family)